MREQEVFILADETLNGIVRQIKASQWDMKMPESFAMTTSGAEIVTLRDVINYHAYDDAWIPDMLAGRTMEEAGSDKFDGDRLGDAPADNFAEIVERACTAARRLDDPERTVHYTYGDYPAREALWHAIVFRGMRAHDIAEVIGANSDLPEDLLHGLWGIVEPNAEEWRAMGVFPPAVDVPADAPLQDRLLGMTGRKPARQ